MLDSKQLKVLLNQRLDQYVGLTPGEHMPQREKFAQALAEVIIEYLTTYAEIVVPDHPEKMDGPAGQHVVPAGGAAVPSHQHLIPVQKHQHGKII